jgi:hypothetical protein
LKLKKVNVAMRNTVIVSNKFLFVWLAWLTDHKIRRIGIRRMFRCNYGNDISHCHCRGLGDRETSGNIHYFYSYLFWPNKAFDLNIISSLFKSYGLSLSILISKLNAETQPSVLLSWLRRG